MSELIRNIFDHSQSEYFYYGTQFTPANRKVELVISDRGLGLNKTILFDTEEKMLNQNSTENAIKKAFTPGITAYSNHSYAPEEYKNAGMGLAMVKSIVLKADGVINLATSEKSVTYFDEREVFRDCNITGTLLRIMLDLNKLNNVDFNLQLEEVIKSDESKTLNIKSSNRSIRI